MRTDRRDPRDRNRAWPDRSIAAIASRQATNVAYAQLLALGIPASSIQDARGRGRLYPVHHGVYSLVPERLRPPLAAERAALLACGPEALLSHWTAARLHGMTLIAPAPVLHVTVVGTERGRSRAGLCVHRAHAVHRHEAVRLSGLAATSPARTVIDLSPSLGDRALERALDQALKRSSQTKFAEALERHTGRPGTPRLRALIGAERAGDTFSEAEELLLALIRSAGLPLPEVNASLENYVPDFLWREQRVIVEFDSWAHHSGPGAFHQDNARHNDLEAWGFKVLHVDWRALTQEPARVIEWIADALASG